MSSTQTTEKLTLFSVLPPQTLLSQLEVGFIVGSDKATLQRLWESANLAYRSNDVPSRSFVTSNDIRVLEGLDQSKIATTLKRVKLYSPYDSHVTGLFEVRINKLVTPQITVNPVRAQDRTKVSNNASPDELFDLAFESAGKPESITRQILGMTPGGGSVVFTSFDEDIRLHHPPKYRSIPLNDEDSSSPSFENVCMAIGGGSPIAAAFRVPISQDGTRLILSNGIHRVYRLAEMGYEWCTLAVTDLIPLEIPDPFVNLPKSILLDPNSNPPLITDFLNRDVVIPLEFYRVLKTIRLNWNFEQYATVLR